MNMKHTWKKAAALVLALGLTLGATGCEFFVPDNVRDLEQVVATVDISGELSDGKAKATLNKLIDDEVVSTDIYKRELVALFLSSGYSYVQSGYSYKDTFNMLMDSLTGRKILTQYALAHYIAKDTNDADALAKYTAEELKAVTNVKEKALLEEHPEVLTMKYYLTDFGSDDAEAKKAYYEVEYQLKASLNSSLDSAEASYVKESADAHSHDETRTTPNKANTTKEDYVPMTDAGALDYDVYTGRNALDSCGEYEKIAGSTKSTRMKAYNAFLANLQSYGLIKEGENASYITQLNYYYEELSSALGLALVNKYYEELQDKAVESLTDEKVFEEYQTLLKNQENSYTNNRTAFESAMDGVSDNAFLLYGLENYGYVYNILLPFSQTQSQMYSAAKSKYADEKLYEYRESLLNNVKAEDLRDAWFCTEEAEHYAYEGEDGKYYFFEDNFTDTDKYETMTQYAGKYAYNGTAELVDDEWKFDPVSLTIDTFMDTFIDYVSTTAGVSYERNDNANYGVKYYLDDKKTEVNYNAFVYSTGKFNVTETSPENFFNPETDAYKALSAVNELMFAYSTDTGCLNTYMGYSVNAHKTSFVSEFEYAAQWVVKQGVGAYAVVPSDYGWHIIYCSYVFNGGNVYNFATPEELAKDRETEGTFSYLFYEALKATSAQTQSNAVQSALIKEFDGSVELFTDAYKDLLEIE